MTQRVLERVALGSRTLAGPRLARAPAQRQRAHTTDRHEQRGRGAADQEILGTGAEHTSVMRRLIAGHAGWDGIRVSDRGG